MFTRAVAVAAVTALAAIPAVSASASGGGSSGIEVGGTSIGYFVGASSTTSSAGSTGSSATEVPGLAQAGSSGDAKLAAGAPGGYAPGGGAPAGCGFPYVCLGSGIYAGIAPPYIPPASAAPPANASQPAVPPAALAAQAWHDLDLPAPVIETAPPRGTDGLVGLREYFWLAPGQWTPKTTQAQAGKTSVQVSAIPQRLVIQPGPGLPALACDGPGTPYSTVTAHDPCSYTYQESSLFQPARAYQVTAAVTWGGTWTGSGGTGGTLPPVTRTAVFALPVEEGQALVSNG